MKDFKCGFTLSEVLVTLAVIVVIVAVGFPVMKNILPDRDEETYKKNKFEIEQVVAQLIADGNVYPELSNPDKAGFNNTDSVIVNGTEYSGETKFCKLFASRFIKTNENDCLDNADAYTDGEAITNTVPTFTATDKIDWYVSKGTFGHGYEVVIADLNGSDCPNTTNLSTPGEGCTGNYKNPDRFKYYIRSNGTVVPERRLNPNNKKAWKQKDWVSSGGMQTETTSARPGNKYTIETTIVCNGGGEGCGSVKILDLAGEEQGKTDLLAGTYVLKVTPNSGYYSEWKDNQKIIKLSGTPYNKKVTVRFSPISYKNLYVNINGCQETKTGTEGKEVTDLDECIEEIQVIKYPNWQQNDNIKTGEVIGEGGESKDISQPDENLNTYVSLGLEPGNYKLRITPKKSEDDGYAVVTRSDMSYYDQDFKLGTSDLTYNIDIAKYPEVFTVNERTVVNIGGRYYDLEDRSHEYICNGETCYERNVENLAKEKQIKGHLEGGGFQISH
ncbi:prepilin-type N-terminal cleavage/methylation domain-containing protein [bacterium]|nr:prepilin-type N-terminal cleavage/methylation domain-containing protein [bacterium]